jgi:hypothetical protein
MNLRHAATLALIGWCFVAALTIRTAEAAGSRKITELEFFIGSWVVQGQGVDFSGKAFKLNGHYSIERVLDGAWLTTSGDFLGAKLQEYWGYDAANQEFLRIAFQSNGTFAVLRSAGWKDASLVWIGEVTGPDGHRTAIRSTQTRKDDNEILVTWERRIDSTWKVYSSERVRRISD